jgi:hypothetical protein
VGAVAGVGGWGLRVGQTGKIQRVLPWVPLVRITLLVILTVLVPFYGSGGHYPSPPGTSPTLPDEFYGISLFRGTLWEDRFWTNLFWNVGCYGWCFWLPALFLVIAKIPAPSSSLPPREKWMQWIVFGVIILAGILGFLTALNLLGEIVD